MEQAVIVLRRIQQFFASQIEARVQGDEASAQHALRLATAALLIEVTRADYHVDSHEQGAVMTAVRELFALGEQETAELIALAQEEAKQSVSLFQFTELVDKHFSAEQKAQIIEMMWRVAYADRRKDHHEEHLVRKVADLLHVSHSAFVRARHIVETEQEK